LSSSTWLAGGWRLSGLLVGWLAGWLGIEWRKISVSMPLSCGLPQLIDRMSQDKDLWMMGHGQDHSSLDIGLGWTYYGITRSHKPKLAVVIGSWRGFVPMLIAQAIQDTGNNGRLLFIDPSLVDEQWSQGRTDAYFSDYGLQCIDHRLQTSQELIADPEFALLEIDLLFIDGLHTEEQCRLEFEAFSRQLTTNAITLFHDTHSRIQSKIYGADKPYTHTVCRYMDVLRARDDLQVFDLPIDQGITLIQRRHCIQPLEP
jgi:predicted O-methyltransferase YrrM